MLRSDMRNFPILILLFAGWIIPGLTISQSLGFQHFTTADGLPDMTVYHSIQDQNGYLWFGTGSGACRFDGHDFEQFWTEDGITGNEVLEMALDSNHRLWIFPHRSFPCYVEDGRFKTFRAVPDSVRALFVESFCDSKGRLWMSDRGNRGEVMLLEGGEVKTFPHFLNESEGEWRIHRNFTMQFSELPDGSVAWADKYHLIRYAHDELDALDLPEGFAAIWGTTWGKFMVLYNENPKELALVKVDFEAFEKVELISSVPFEHGVNELLVDRDGYLWVASNDGLLRFRLNGDEIEMEDWNLKGIIVSSLQEDREGNIWITTLAKGVYLLTQRAKHCRTIELGKGREETIHSVCGTADGVLYAGTENGYIHSLERNEGGGFAIDTLPFKRAGRVRKLLRMSSTEILAARDAVKTLLVGNRQGVQESSVSLNSVKEVFRESDSTILLGTNWGVFRLERNKLKEYEACMVRIAEQNPYAVALNCGLAQLFNQPTYSIAKDQEGAYWFGARNGIYLLRDGGLSYLGKMSPLLAASSTAIEVGEDGAVWMGAMGRGIGRFQNGRLDCFRAADGLISDLVTSLLVESDSVLWVGTSSGVSRLLWKDGAFQKDRTINISTWEGLPGSDVNDLEMSGDTLFVATMSGLAFVTAHEFERSLPKTMVTRVRINGRDTTLLPHYSLSHRQDLVQIDYAGLYLQNPPSVSYRYRLIPLDTAWRETSQRSLSISNIAPGSYRFEVQALAQQGRARGNVAVVAFEVHPALYQRIWFRIVVTAMGLLLLGLLLWWRWKTVRRRNMLQQRLLEARRQALQSQMSPHFIFNSLNAIQECINSGDIHNANISLARFGDLIRSILQYSGQTAISLREEIDFLSEYLEMALFRFNDDFHYELLVDEHLDLMRVQLPPLILQPFVENAILHGLLPAEGKGSLRIQFEADGDSVLCSVTDNGIGRKRSAAIRANRINPHESMGIRTTADRIALFNEQENARIEWKIEDLYGEQGEAKGTRVELLIRCSPAS